MKTFAIYVEGGGESTHLKSSLRSGFDQLLNSQKQAARNKRLSWRLVMCGSRNEAHDAFLNSVRHADPETLSVLLVDSEEGLVAEEKGKPDVNARNRRMHLSNRDGWDLKEVEAQQIHLMVQCMETWIIADPKALEDYYGQGFRSKSLPDRKNLEEEPKSDLFNKLGAATSQTQKGEYSKRKHAPQLLAKINASNVAKRCPRFATLSNCLDQKIGSE